MIALANAPIPAVLAANQAAWTATYKSWLNTKIGPEPRHYAHPDLRSALSKETSGKCAYCEAIIGDVSYEHVEHKRPKRKNPDLVCEWGNLTVGCTRCNTNKDEYDDQTCPLLDPYVDDVEKQLVFGGPLALPRGGARARITITKLKLNRERLLYQRGQALERIDEHLDLIVRAKAAGELDAEKALWSKIDLLTSPEAEFASACKYFLESEVASRGLTRPV